MLPWSRSQSRSKLSMAIRCHPCGLSSFGHSAPSRLPNDLLANRCSLACPHSQPGTGNKQGRSRDRSMDPKHWLTEQTSIQGTPGPLGLGHPCNHLKKLPLYEVPQKSAGRRTARRVLNIQEGIVEASNNHVRDSAEQASDQGYLR